MDNNTLAPIGVFDSGIGGLSVLRAICTQIPGLHAIYVADQIHVPYGPRRIDEIRAFSEAITRILIEQNVKLIVVACNTASAAALTYLRQKFMDIQFVGMEPAVKPAAEQTRSGVVGVLATPATLQGALYMSVVERFTQGVTVLQDTCPGLVGQIEQGNLTSVEIETILIKALTPMLEKGIDTIVLGCTHYPYVIPLIRKIVGPEIRIIDPAPAVARQVGRLLKIIPEPLQDAQQGNIQYFSTKEPQTMEKLLPQLMGAPGKVEELSWTNDTLLIKKLP